MILHIIKKNLNNLVESHSLFEYLKSNQTDKIVLIEDAVYSYNHKALKHCTSEQLFILESDYLARDLTVPLTIGQLIGFEGFVELTVQCEQSMTW